MWKVKNAGSDKKLTMEQVWRKFVLGDEASFKPIYIHYYEVLFGYGLKLCNNESLVRDSIQDMLKYIWENREKLEHINSANVYLFVSLRRTLLRALKKGRAVTHLDEDFEFDEIEFSVEEVQIKKENNRQLREMVSKALNTLTARQKEIVILFYFNGMSYGEIEQIIGINRQSVRNHMHRAITCLREYLEPEMMKLVI